MRSLSDVVDCYSQTSSISGSSSNFQQARIDNACSDTGYTLVSCGYRTADSSAYENMNGGFITGTNCIAQAATGYAVYAIARCCDFRSYTMTCSSNQGGDSPIGDDEESWQNCGHLSLSNSVMVGWYVLFPFKTNPIKCTNN